MAIAYTPLAETALTPDSFKDWVNRIHTAENETAPVTAAELAPDDTFAPPTWDSLVGQLRVRDELQVRIHSALSRGAAMPHTLLVGPPGTGKTTIARLIAMELDRPLKVIEKPPSSAANLIDSLYGVEDGVMFADEIHLWPTARQADLLELTESGTLQGTWGAVAYPNLTVVGATTDPQKLGGPLKTRFMCQPRWEDYTRPEMAKIATGMAERAGVEISHDDAMIYGTAGAGCPRAVRGFIIAARDLAEIGRDFSGPTVLHFCATEPDGLTLDHLDLLESLATSKDGTAGLDTMVQMLNMPAGQIRDLEALLMKRHYVGRSGQGRQITGPGRTRLKASR